MVSRTFYPFVEDDAAVNTSTDVTQETSPQTQPLLGEHITPARVAVYDDAAAAPRVIIIEPSDVRTYLEEITKEVTRLSQEQGGKIPFMVIREVVENLIHAYFSEPIISILPGGNTIRFSDQGPGIKDKDRALEYGTTTATEEMKRYIRGVGSGLPYVQQYLLDKGGSLLVEDNMGRGTIVTISMGTAISKEDLSATQEPNTTDQNILSTVSQRGQLILTYLQTYDRVGPKDLVSAYGLSAATWSRELRSLDDAGILVKQPDGQKRFLTPLAKQLLSTLT